MSPSGRDKLRLDELIVELGLATDKDKAAALLLAGHLRVGPGDGARRDRKPGELVARETPVTPVDRPTFVSRGGHKLEAALDAFEIDPSGWTCLDVGASTGGFTDVLLRRGARRVYALDVGRGQLADSLRRDARVVSLERTHAARLHPQHPQAIRVGEPVDLATVDVSFISLTRILGPVQANLTEQGQIVALVKPQFELPPALVPGGVVRSDQDRRAAIEQVSRHASSLGLHVAGELESPLPGPAGNREQLLQLVRR